MLSDENINEAYKQVKRNKGAPGIDGMTVSELKGYLEENLDVIKEQIRTRKYKPSPVKRVEIPKDNGGTRNLGVPTVIDRLIQQAIVQILTPIYEPLFSDSSYGFRPNRCCEMAIIKALEYMNDGYEWVVDIDLEKFFDTVNHDKLISILNKEIKDGKILSLIRKLLVSGVMVGTQVKETEMGTPQGGNLSPLLANIMLNELDWELERRGLRFVRYADDCIISDGRNKKLNYQAVIERLEKTEGNQIGVVRVEETYSHDFSLDPVYYLHNMIEVQSGQTLVKFRDMTTQIRGERRFDDVTGRVLLSEHLCVSITEFHTRSIDINSIELVNPDRYVKVSNKCVILNMTADKFYYKNDNDPLFVSPNFSCFEVNENICLPEYLIHVLLDNKRIRETYSQGIISRVNYNELYLPIYTNLRSQRLIVERIYRQEQNELKKKLEKLQVLSGKSSDLIHNLGITFTKMSAAIAVLRKENATSTQIDSPVNVLNDNIQFALRQINCTGTDFSHVKPELEKVNLYKTVSNYIMAWKNFGYKSFDVAPIKLNVSEDTMVEIDKDLFFTMLDCIFINAHQHGFNKRYNSHNKVIIDLQGVYADNNKYVMIGISNNGNPLTDGYSIKDFVERGNVGLNSSQDGLGGNHVMEIAHHFGGKISIVSESEWLSFNVLLPIYLTSDDTKFIEYGGEYI